MNSGHPSPRSVPIPASGPPEPSLSASGGGGSSGTLRAASAISAATMLSRVLGLLRDMLMLRMLGSGLSGTFVFAWMLPNLFRRLFGEGALGAAFIPQYVAVLDREGKGTARGLLASITGTLLIGLGSLSIFVVLGCLITPPAWFGTGEEGGLLLRLSAILFPYVILICLTGVYASALNSLSIFGLPATLPVLLNLFWIAGLGAGVAFDMPGGADRVILLAWFLLAGGLAQLALAALALRRRGHLPRPSLPRGSDRAGPVLRAMLPAVLGMSLVQINGLIDQGIAYFLISPNANAHVYLANRLLLFPHALTSLALATAAFPQMAMLVSREALGGFRRKLDETLHLTLWLAVPASVGLILVAPDFIGVFFQHDRFTPEDARWSTWTTATLVGGLPFIGMIQLQARAFYALSDPATPARVTASMIPLNLALDLGLLLGLGMGAPGLTLASSLCAVVNASVLARKLQRRCPGAGVAPTDLARIGLATMVMGFAVVLTHGMSIASTDLEKILFHLALPILVGMASYALVHAALKDPILRRLRRDRGHSMRKNSM